MTIAIYAQLAVLALIDSTSIGTLLIPLWLLLRPDARRMVPRILLYLGVLAFFYLLVGIVMLSGADWAISGMGGGSMAAIPAVQWAMVLAGGGMLAYALMAKPGGKDPAKKTVAAGADRASAGSAMSPADTPAVASDPPTGAASVPETPAVEIKWQQRLSTALRSPGGIVGLALIAGLLELPTMLPYVVAIGVLSNSALALPGEIGVLAVYCLVMLLPALVLVGLRLLAGQKLDALLRRLSSKLGAFASETLLWVLGIVGFLLLRGGLSALAPDAPWNPFK
ncbi:GAP family protein [Arthrobacter sp. PAMC 25486]|uniref:GAP family protein n=1 Tax=Arthrobacter sp. PAMC 25486 TaxID=1494608 RepID=UPI0012FED317|nr:GAP family protein [Arthrobacter sp. PAMC 25486]